MDQKKDYSEILYHTSKWGDKEPVHINITPKLLEFIFEAVGLDPKIEKKSFKKKLQQKDISTEITISQEFISKVTEVLGQDNISFELKDRIENSIGKSYLDLLRARLSSVTSIVQMVVYPRTHDEVQSIIKLANTYKVNIGTVAGGSSVIQGIEAINDGIVINTRKMNKIITINEESQYVIVQPGIFGPELELKLNEIGYCLNHTPQSFEYSAVGGWVATRGAGQQSTLFGKIEEMVLGLKVVTGNGKTIETKIAPARSSGPELIQIFAGSEGTLGIITEVVLRINKISQLMLFSSFMFKDFKSGLAAYREILQNGFKPSILRLSDGEETHFNVTGNYLMKEELTTKDKVSQLVLNYLSKRGYDESKRCLLISISEGSKDLAKVTNSNIKKICKKQGGFSLGSSVAKSWINSRYEAPFLRDPFVDYGLVVETLETATTWDKIPDLYQGVRKTLKTECPIILAHISHAYPSGANIYFTMITKQEDGQEEQQYQRIKTKALNAFMEHGGVISHHHGVGRAFNDWLEEEITPEGIKLFTALKNSLDPNWILNSGIFNLKKKK